MNSILREITSHTKVFPPTVLNIGSGNGYLEEKAKEMGMNIYSLDIDESTAKRLSQKGIIAKQGYIENMPFENTFFDYVIASEVLEHLKKNREKKVCWKSIVY